MKIQVFSDLHVDVSQPPPIAIGLDVGRTRVLCNPRGYPAKIRTSIPLWWWRSGRE